MLEWGWIWEEFSSRYPLRWSEGERAQERNMKRIDRREDIDRYKVAEKYTDPRGNVQPFSLVKTCYSWRGKKFLSSLPFWMDEYWLWEWPSSELAVCMEHSITSCVNLGRGKIWTMWKTAWVDPLKRKKHHEVGLMSENTVVERSIVRVARWCESYGIAVNARNLSTNSEWAGINWKYSLY